MYLLGLDIGTGGCKATLMDFQGNVIYSGTREYPTHYPKEGWAEQDPEDWYNSACALLRDIVGRGVPAEDITAMCVSAATHTAVLLDDKLAVVRRAILWTDQRSAPQSERLHRELGEEILEITCNKVSPVWTLPQLEWVRENEPDIWARVSSIMFAKDYVRWRLTATRSTDWIDAAGSMLFDPCRQAWSERLCEILSLPAACLPPTTPPESVVGTIIPAAAVETGLSTRTLVVTGTTDTALEVFGAGALDSGQATLKLATAGRVCAITERPHPHPHLFNYRHVLRDRWYPGTGTKSCASSFRWFRDVFCGCESEVARIAGQNAYELIDSEAAKAPVGAEGLLFHPYLLGELSPYNDPHLKASFTGITMRHSKAHFARAVLEGVALSLLDSMSVLEELAIPINDIRVIGGGARSALWRQIICDAIGRSVSKPRVDDSSFGGAMLAGIGAGVFADARTAVTQCVRLSDPTVPNPDNHLTYRTILGRYKAVHDCMAEVYHKG
ncbi:MAG: xylulokinase [Firmicutes bacterium]|jgi:xylulokinase|nr:xylulokinase [Bacillota bacterium]